MMSKCDKHMCSRIQGIENTYESCRILSTVSRKHRGSGSRRSSRFSCTIYDLIVPSTTLSCLYVTTETLLYFYLFMSIIVSYRSTISTLGICSRIHSSTSSKLPTVANIIFALASESAETVQRRRYTSTMQSRPLNYWIDLVWVTANDSSRWWTVNWLNVNLTVILPTLQYTGNLLELKSISMSDRDPTSRSQLVDYKIS